MYIPLICLYQLISYYDIIPFEIPTHSQEASKDFPATEVAVKWWYIWWWWWWWYIWCHYLE